MADTFFIRTPDGYEVQVRADSREQAIEKVRGRHQEFSRIIARDGTNRVVESPSTGKRMFVGEGYSTTDQEQISRILEGMQSGGGEQATARESRRSFNEQILDDAGPGVGLAQEYVRGGLSLGSYFDEALGAVAGDDAKQAARAVSGAMQEERPGQTLAANIAGGVVSSAGAAASAPAALTRRAASALTGTTGSGTILPTLGRTVPAAMGAGAVEGAVYGAGEGTDAEGRVEQAATGAAFGAGGGLLGGAVAPALRRGSRNVVDRLRRGDVPTIAAELGISQDAARVIRNTFDEGGDIEMAMANLNRAGDSAMLADAGEAAQALLDASAATGGRAAQTTRAALRERAEDVSGRTMDTINETLGEAPLGPRRAVAEISRRTADARKEAYDRAYGQAIDYASDAGREIERQIRRIDPSIVDEAVRRANMEMRADEVVNQQIKATISDNGEVVFEEMPNVRQLDYIKRALNDLAEGARGEFGKQTSDSRLYGRLASGLRNAIGNAVEGYDEAVRLGGDTIAEQNAFILGRNALNPKTEIEDVLEELGDNPTDAQVEAARMGMRSALQKVLGDVRAVPSNPDIEARQLDALLRLTSSDNARRKIREVMGSEADRLLTQMDEVAQTALVRTATNVNSKTAVRQSVQGSVDQMSQPGIVGQIMRGEPVNTTQQLVQAVTGQTDELTERRRQEIFADIAQALTERRGEEAKQALNLITRAMRGEELNRAQNEFLAQQIATVVGGGAGVNINRARQREDAN